jgi:hypothetical protein
VSFDSFYDRRTAYRFEVNPDGVRRDAALSAGARRGGGGGGGGGGAGGGGRGAGGGGGGGALGGQEGDLAWDAVWEAATSTDPDGWSVEMRIPFSQLRFGSAEEQVWGLQIERLIDRRQEWAQFSFTPKSEQGGIPAYGELRDLRGIRPGRPLELTPYVLSQGQFLGSPASALAGSREFGGNVGLDLKYRVASNATLTATVNPDFGQVEVDPAVINLTAFETRFEERRPFFVEGSSMFEYAGTLFGPPRNTSGSLLYTRRMGRAPQVEPDADDFDFPDSTTILGAAKLSAKSANGWSVGTLNVLTGREDGRYLDAAGAERHALAEPRANYFVTRVSRELRQGQSSIGGLLTAVNRDLTTDAARSVLHASAYTGGVDFAHEFAGRSWILTGFLAGSRVAGAPEAIRATQESSQRYFQRPDASDVTLDPARRTLEGMATTVQLRKTAGLHWRSDTWVQMISPGFEINDIGFLQRADRRGFGQSLWYWERTPGRILREWRLINSMAYARNFDGDVIDHQYRSQLSLTHLSYWELEIEGQYEPRRTDDRLTRGGPLAIRPATWTSSVSLQTDPRKPVFGQVRAEAMGDRVGSHQRTVGALVNIRTSSRWNVSLGPNLLRVFQDAQYVTEVEDAAMAATGGYRRIFAPLRQTEFSLVTRVNYTFTPDLSLEVYLQPLVSNGRYADPKEFQRPSAYEFLVYGRDIGTIARVGGDYLVDPDGAGPLQPFTFENPTFTTRSLRGNAVFRWEYRPGSTLYVVWQQDRLNEDVMSDFSVRRGLGSLFGTGANNSLVVKWTYWLNP